MINAELLRLGYAQVSTYPPDVKHVDLFLQLQQEAREAERGLWGPTPTVPSTATPQPTPTAEPSAPPAPTTPPTEVPSAPADVQIAYIYFDGQVPRVGAMSMRL